MSTWGLGIWVQLRSSVGFAQLYTGKCALLLSVLCVLGTVTLSALSPPLGLNQFTLGASPPQASPMHPPQPTCR